MVNGDWKSSFWKAAEYDRERTSLGTDPEQAPVSVDQTRPSMIDETGLWSNHH